MSSGIDKDYLKSLQNQTVSNTKNKVISGAINYAQNTTSTIYTSDLFNLVDSSNTTIVDSNIQACLSDIQAIFYNSKVTFDISGNPFKNVNGNIFTDINGNTYTEINGILYDSNGNFFTSYITPDASGNITFTVDWT